MRRFFLVLILFAVLYPFGNMEGKKIKRSHKVKTEKDFVGTIEDPSPSIDIILSDSLLYREKGESKLLEATAKISFAGYEKEANSNKESFIMVNRSDFTVIGFEVKVEYLDMQDRMLHSRLLKENCNVPAGESRHIDAISWDKQHTYYYYLGNAPRRVATPYKVRFKPVSYTFAIE